MARGYRIGWQRYRTFSSLQKVLLDSAAVNYFLLCMEALEINFQTMLNNFYLKL